ncbi:MAG: hypothetical protein JNL08_07625 [Planctomycetes bacterium]|nr:hypothetical protein [Planctomycetota bacterium]
MSLRPDPRPVSRAILLLLAVGAALRAQEPPPELLEKLRQRGITVAAEPAPGQDPAAAAAGGAANALLQQWKQLKFDRRPSAILQAWAAPELKPYDPAEEKGEPAAPTPAGQPEVAAGAGAEVDPGAAGEPEPEPTPPAASTAPAPTAAALPDGAPAAAPAPDPAAAAKAAAAAKEKQLAAKRQQRELEMLQRDVTLGRWSKVGAFLQSLPEKERTPAYEHFLTAVLTAPPPPNPKVPPNLLEKNRFSFQDALELAGLAPGGFGSKQAPKLAPIVQRAIEGGSVHEELLRLLAAEIARPAAEQRLDRREAALLLAAIGEEDELTPFLPTLAEAEAANDREGLNLLARCSMARFAKDKDLDWLEQAWNATQAALAKGEVEAEAKTEALLRAVELAPKVREGLGPQWLADSFTQRPERGMEIVATIGGQVAKGFEERAQDPDYRAKTLQLQKTAVDALLRVAPQLADQWRPTLGLLAAGWIGEAVYSCSNSQSDSMGQVMERDEFGNIFWTSRRRGGGGPVKPVEPVDLIEAQPGSAWAELLDDALEPHFATVSAQLFLKLAEPERAFPFIEQLATINARKAKELADEFLRVWTRNNNPNTSRRTNSYMFIYGFDQRASGIPLTRSKQERNLQELGSWVERLRQLPIGRVDETLLTEAFVAAHSKAEVYRLETIEKVFGDVAELDPVLLGELLGTMRTNLATVWRRPDVQEDAKTKRSQRETLLEVAQGYDTALEIAQRALQERGRHWALLTVVGSILHDRNNFARELGRSSDFAGARKAAFELFAQAAQHYAETAGDLRLDQETLRPFDVWFYAALGASDLGAVDEETVLAESQLPRIRAAIDALPAGSRERHLGMFANALFTRMSAVKPQIKHRYLEAGFAIVGDHPQAAEAKKVWDYYADLTRELRLEAVVEGATAVGTAPFGVRLDIVHTAEIERESGGFAKYAQNQNNMSYAWNYGRPLEDYRDRFQDAVTATLQESFEVLSVTFNGDQMTSRPSGVPGWRTTPYAWLLLRARGPQVDRIPTLKLDFDFLDTSGYVVLPIGSSPVAIDASSDGGPRPCSDLKVVQLLDERRADEGKVVLEVKASAKGLVPDLDALLRVDAPGFRVDKRDDQGASVVRFADDQQTVETERVWLLSLTPASEGSRPASFVFGKPVRDGVDVVYQRYNDADLETVAAEVVLAGGHRPGNPVWAWFLVAGAAAGYGAWFFLARRHGAAAAVAPPLLRMPAHVTPFTVLEVLYRAERHGRLDDGGRRDLRAAIERIEACHFGRAEDPTLDLAAVAAEWIRRIG